MKEDREMRRFLVIVMLAILVSQPLIALSGGLAVLMGNREYATALAEPERGCRFSGENLTDHVPVLIHNTTDFVSQGWPGAGSQTDPYVISRLNITYDVGLVGITVLNTDAYFVIRDCFIKQVVDLECIRLNDTSHASIEYTTAISPTGPIYCEYTNNLKISRSVATAGVDMALMIQHANFTLFEWNLFSSTSMRGLYAYDCYDLRSEHNEYVASSPSWNCAYLTACHRASSEYDRSYLGYIGLYVSSSENVTIVGFEGNDNQIGINTVGSPRVAMSDCHIASAADRGIDVDTCPNATIDGCTVVLDSGSIVGIDCGSSGGTSITTSDVTNADRNGILIMNSPNSVVYQCGLVDCGSGQLNDAAVMVYQSNDTSVIDNEAHGTDGTGIVVYTSHRIALEENIVRQSSEHGVLIDSSENVTVLENEITETGMSGFYVTASSRADVQGNIADDLVEYGMRLVSSDYVNVYNNDVSNAGMAGISFEGGIEANVEQNTLRMCQSCITLNSHTNASVAGNDIDNGLGGIAMGDVTGSIVADNSITQTYYAIQVVSSHLCTIEQNTVEESTVGVTLEDSDGLTLTDNSISCSGGQGISVTGSLNLTFDGNQMMECGFIFTSFESEAYYNHTFTSNSVNGRPAYYRWNGTDIALAGSSYGQIILLSCEDVTVTGGTFHRSTVAIQAFYCEEIHLVDITSDENIAGLILRGTFNSTMDGLTVTDSVEGINLYDCDFLDAEDISVSRVQTAAFLVHDSTNMTIRQATVEYGQYGVDATNSPYGTVLSSDFNHISQSGILAGTGSHSWNVTDCRFFNMTNGIDVNAQYNWRIFDSVFRHCGNGIRAYSSMADNGWVVRSQFDSNTNGMWIRDGASWRILNCSIRWSSGYGISFINVATPEVHGNTIALSGTANGYSSLVQYWDDGVSVGNSWHDYDGTPPYQISGAGATDRYPSLYLPTEPIIDNLLDVSYAEFSTGYYLEWHPYDDYLRDWAVTIDGLPWAAEAWNFDSIYVNIDGLGYGTHTLVVTVWDINGNLATDEVTIHVFDDTPPIISQLPDTEAFVGGTGQLLTWEASDLHPSTYVLMRDGEQVDSGDWEGGTVSASLDGLSLGEYRFTMTVYDEDGNYAQDTVTVLVIADTTTPTIDSPLDIVSVIDTTGNQIIWNATDNHPKSYEVVENNSVVASGIWAGGRIILSLDALPVGTYDFTVTVRDGAGHNASDTVNVRVIPYAGYLEPPPPLDWMTLLLIGGVGGTAIVVVTGALYLRKRKTT